MPVHGGDLLVVSVLDDGSRVGRVHLPVNECSSEVSGGEDVVMDGMPGESWREKREKRRRRISSTFSFVRTSTLFRCDEREKNKPEDVQVTSFL